MLNRSAEGHCIQFVFWYTVCAFGCDLRFVYNFGNVYNLIFVFNFQNNFLVDFTNYESQAELVVLGLMKIDCINGGRGAQVLALFSKQRSKEFFFSMER